METRIPPNVETRAAAPTVATSGEPLPSPGRQAAAPIVATSGEPPAALDRGNLEAPPASSFAVCGCRFGCGLDDLAKLIQPVHFQNPRPIVTEPQPLPDSIPPDNRRDTCDGMIGGSRIQLGKLAGGLGAAPMIQLSDVLDDHNRIIPDRGNRRNPRTWKPKFSKSQLSIHPPIVQTPRENEKKILGLTRPMTMISFMRGRSTPAVETR